MTHKTAKIREVPFCRGVRGLDAYGLARGHFANSIPHQHQWLGTQQPARVDFVINIRHDGRS